MRMLSRPDLRPSRVYLKCAIGTADRASASAYYGAWNGMCEIIAMYRHRAESHRLFEFSASRRGLDDQVVLGRLTKGNLTALYDKGMVASPKGRRLYDRILASAPLGKCPYCQFGQAETLDHFLSKSRYPALSVLPDNLVPACMRCNKGKGSDVVTEESEMSHPYFEDQRIEQDRWLKASVAETVPVTATYRLSFAADWPIPLARRVENYFGALDLCKRFSVEASSELTSISALLAVLPSHELRVQHLIQVAEVERELHTNSWKAALYAALAESTWYVTTGYASR